jgi:polyisoprenoid-binding protein YceI
MIRLAMFIATLFVALAFPAAAAEWQTDPANSEIRFSGSYASSPFTGVFEKWSADINFDPANPAQAKVRVLINTASAATGSKINDGTLKSADWFDVKNHPQAVFEASNFTALDGNRYRAEGVLVIKGTKLPLAFEFQLDVEGATAHLQAGFTLDRIAYGLGVKADPTADWVSREITLDIKLTARKR